MTTDDLLNVLYEILMQLDECMAANDYNAALKKAHEAIARIKEHREEGC